MSEDNDEGFVADYMAECIEKGIASSDAICLEAVKELDKINKELAEIPNKRNRAKNLKSVLRSFNHESMRRAKRIDISMINFDDETEENLSYKEFIYKICDFVEQEDRSVTSREVMDFAGGIEQQSVIYMAIKWLCTKGVLERNEDRTICKGTNWDDRPIAEQQVAKTG